MALQAKENLGDFMPTVKNTFIGFELMATCRSPRRSSVPASSRLCQDSHLNTHNFKLLEDDALSDISTYETDSESGFRTRMNSDDSSLSSAYVSPPDVCMYYQNSCSTPLPALQVAPPPRPYAQLTRLNSKAAAFQPAAPQVVTSSSPHTWLRHLSSKATAFPPQEVPQVCKPHNRHYRKEVAEVIRLTTVLMKQSEHLGDVEVYEDGGCWSVNIQPKVIDEDSWQTELLITLAKKALLEAATKSKCIYVMGYCGSQPFSMRAQGFQATLGAMQNAATTCWHIFKKGFCRHGDSCCKQHPIVQVPVHFLVEGVQLPTCALFANSFKEQVADLALTVTAALGENPRVEAVEALRDHDYPGWTIEVTAKGDPAVSEDDLLTLVKNVLFSATGNPGLLYIIGKAAKPFVQKSSGFVVTVGDMQDESRVCWDMYEKGFCSRGCGACQFEHPGCLMPINVVVKEMNCRNLPSGAR